MTYSIKFYFEQNLTPYDKLWHVDASTHLWVSFKIDTHLFLQKCQFLFCLLFILRIASTFNGWPRLWGQCDAIVVLSGRHVLFCKMTKPYQLFSFCALCGGAHNLKRLLLHVKLSEHHNFSSHLVK